MSNSKTLIVISGAILSLITLFSPMLNRLVLEVDAATTTPTPIPQITPEAETITDKGHIPDFQNETSQSQLKFEGLFQSILFNKAISEWIGRIEPNQGGILWLAILVTLLIAFNFDKPFSWRNVDLLLLLLLSFLFVDVIRFERGLDDPTKFSLFGLVFVGIFLITIILLIRALIRAFITQETSWSPNLATPTLAGLLIFLLASNTFLALIRFPDDAGSYTNKGVGQMIKTGKYPYGDPILRGGSAATYGPVLYLVHIPVQLGLHKLGFHSDVKADENPFSFWVAKGGIPQYEGPPILATKLTLLLFHFLGVIGLIAIGRQSAGLSVGLALACLYTGSAYVQGLGGETHFITGMTFISHIAPVAITILAFATLNTPWLSGALLAVAAGILFYPAFLFPLWFGYYFWKGKGWYQFAAGFMIVVLIIGGSVLLLTLSAENESSFQAFYESTIGHQEARDTYGASTFSFWGTHPKLASFWQEPFIEGWYLLRPSFLIFLIFIGASFFLAKNRTITQFAFLTAAVVISIQLWKSHAGGTYVEWYYPFILIGLFAHPKHQVVYEAEMPRQNLVQQPA